MNVSLTPELEAFVHRKVESGRYTSASEVVREGLRLLEDEEMKFEVLRGVEQIKNREFIKLNSNEELRDYFDRKIKRLRSEFNARQKSK